MTLRRAAFLVAFVALASYANSVGNGFAYDDTHIVQHNPVVTTADPAGAVLTPYWPEARAGSGLYRPVTILSFALEWEAFGGSPLELHLVNVLGHTLVSILVLFLLAQFVTVPGALAGAALFAVHPLHVEAVANIVGRAEIYAAVVFLGACLLYVRGRTWTGGLRAARLAGIALLYLLGLGSKEIAVTLPAVLVLLEVSRPDGGSAGDRVRQEAPLYASLVAVLVGYLLLRTAVLGTFIGEVPAPVLRGLGTGERVLTALTIWPEYLRLLFFPLDLSADYSPAVILVARSVTVDVVVGGLVLLGLLVVCVAIWKKASVAAVGIAWFGITILPVSNLLFPAGVLLAERTLYLPSVGLSFVAAALVARLQGLPSRDRVIATVVGVVIGALLMVRTVTRNPTWLDTFTVLNTLAVEHPESYLSLRSRGMGLARVGETDAARRAYDAAVALAPRNYSLLVEAGDFYARLRDYPKADSLLRRAIRATPDQAPAYRLLSEQLIRQGRGREGHAVALDGLAHVGADRELFALLSESYIAKGDLEAAVRARRAALAQDPDSAEDWRRLAELLEALDRPDEARRARARERALIPTPPESD